jgi:hypothetical protein
MTTQFYRVWHGKSRAPNALIAKVHATSAEDAIAQVKAQPAYRGKDWQFQAEPAHTRTVRGK